MTGAEAPGNFLRMISGSLEKRWHKIPARLSSRKIRKIENEKFNLAHTLPTESKVFFAL